MDHDLKRFLTAQDGVDGVSQAQALAEIRDGHKRSHWIWYVFPQLAGLGQSSAARHYGLRGVDEAMAYLGHPILRARLGEITTAAAEQIERAVPLDHLMGSSIDAQKLVSCMSLFGELASRAARTADRTTVGTYERLARDAQVILVAAAAQGYPPCAFTLRALGR